MRILWYVHDHGVGHLQRCLAVLPFLESQVVVASGRKDLRKRVPDTVSACVLPSDVVDGAEAAGPWHYAPPGDATRARTASLIDAVRAHDCTTAVVDVSAETSVLCRLAGLRVVALRQSGRRNDVAHRVGFESADAVWVPQHRDLEPLDGRSASLPLHWTGAFSRFDRRTTTRPAARSELGVSSDERLLVLTTGQGGDRFPVAAWQAHDCTPGVTVVILGLDAVWERGAIRSLGRVEDPHPWLVAADGVVSSAGWASVHDAVAARANLAVVAECRPFGEQQVRAAELDRRGLVVQLDDWPTPDQAECVLDLLSARPPSGWDEFYDRRGAERSARLIDTVHHGR